MDLLQKLSNAPAALFDYVMDCENEGFIPSEEDMLDQFGNKYEEWKDLFPDVRKELESEVDDVEFISPRKPYSEYRDRGLNLWRDFG